MIFCSVFNPNPTFSTVKVSSLTPTYVVYAGTAGLLSGSANLTFDETNLTCLGYGLFNGYTTNASYIPAATSGIIKGVWEASVSAALILGYYYSRNTYPGGAISAAGQAYGLQNNAGWFPPTLGANRLFSVLNASKANLVIETGASETGNKTCTTGILYDTSVALTDGSGASGVPKFTTLYHYRATTPTRTALGTITTLYAFYDAGQSLAWATTYWGCAINTQSYFNANVRIGSAVAPTVALDITGAALISTTLGVTGLSTLTGGALVNSDTNKVSVGAGTDAAFYYDGTNGNIDTDLVAPSDLTIDCGTEKTLVLEVPVWKDINYGAANFVLPSSGYPDRRTFLDEAGNSTGIETIAFDLTQGVSFSFEIQHDYLEGSDLTFHVHWQGIAAPAGGTDNVQWRISYTITRDGQTMNAVTTVDSPDQAITAQYQCVRSSFAIIEGTTGGYDGGYIRIGDQFNCRLSREAADADEYAGEAYLITAGVHYQIDTIGSRQIGTK